MRKLMNTLALIALATVTNAQIVRVGTYDQDAFVYGVNGSSDSGYVNVSWSGYETPSVGNAGWRVVVWDTNAPQYPIASETYHASSYDSNYSRTFAVPPYHAVRVELYAVGDQYSNGINLSSTVTTSMWVQPINTMGGTSTSYPVYTTPSYGYPTNTITTPGFPVSILTTPTWNYYSPIVSTFGNYPIRIE